MNLTKVNIGKLMLHATEDMYGIKIQNCGRQTYNDKHLIIDECGYKIEASARICKTF